MGGVVAFVQDIECYLVPTGSSCPLMKILQRLQFESVSDTGWRSTGPHPLELTRALVQESPIQVP